MAINQSPWLYQLDRKRTIRRLEHDVEVDVAIIGAGIAGIATAFFVLKYTNKRVAVIEAHKMGHGATGHNAGQVVGYFERGFASLTEEFGDKLASEGQRAIEGAWQLIDEIYTDANLDVPFQRFMGVAGITSGEQVFWHLKSLSARRRCGLPYEPMILSFESRLHERMPEEYQGLYRIAPKDEVLRMLETDMPEFVAALPYQKGCLNSALFCQEVHAYLVRTYADRYALYEHTPARKIILKQSEAIIDAERSEIQAARVVLCTNGFENFHIINDFGLDIDAKFHHAVKGKVGYMAAYLDKTEKQPIAVSYFVDPHATPENDYFYLTRRPFEYGAARDFTLVSVGGPEIDLEHHSRYERDASYPDHATTRIDTFIRRLYKVPRERKLHYLFTWHGLMGYTLNGVRMVGPEPQNPILLYNLGCNGVGILPSLFGGRKIARHLAGEDVPPSIFDVPRSRSIELSHGDRTYTAEQGGHALTTFFAKLAGTR